MTTLQISIHTPARGVTYCMTTNAKSAHDFNPHSREGSDPLTRSGTCGIRHFNPHSREGSDGSMPIRCRGRHYFNPHSREGSDQVDGAVTHQVGFQSTLPRGE